MAEAVGQRGRIIALERAIGFLLTTGIVALAALSFVAHSQFTKLEEAAHLTEDTQQTLDSIQGVSLALLDAETGQRGYLLTSQDSYLDPYRSGSTAAELRLTRLANRIAGDPNQQARLERLRTLSAKKLTELGQTIELQAQRPDAALAIVRSNEGKRLMDEVRSVSAEMTLHERAQLEQRTASARQARLSTEFLSGGTLFGLALVFGSAFLLIRRELRLRTTAVAELHTSEARLTLSEQRLKTITDSVPAMIGYVDRSQTYRFVNAGYQRLFPGERSFLGKTIEQILGLNTRAALQENVNSALDGKPCHFERTGMGNRPDATFVVDYIPDTQANGEVHGFYVLALDITERKRVERLLAESEQRTREVAVSDRDLASYVDRDYTYRFVNQTYLDYWLLARDAIEGRTVAELMGEVMFYAVAKPRLDRAFAGEEVRYEAAFDFPGKGRRFVEIAYVPARDADGTVNGVVVRVHDIDALKQTELQLRSAVALLEEKNVSQERLVHTLSHDLREPVNTLVNFSTLLCDDQRTDLGLESQRYLGFIRSGSLRLRSLLDDLLDFVRVENGAIVWETCDLNAILNDTMADLDNAIQLSGGSISSENLPHVAGQQTMLRLLMQNLLANAIKFARAGVSPVVTVTAEGADGFCELRVSDNGIGIPETHRAAVFDLFKRLHSRKAYEGTGLGLALCRRIAEMHGGRIWIDAGANGGTSAHVTLPLQPAVAILAAEKA